MYYKLSRDVGFFFLNAKNMFMTCHTKRKKIKYCLFCALSVDLKRNWKWLVQCLHFFAPVLAAVMQTETLKNANTLP